MNRNHQLVFTIFSMLLTGAVSIAAGQTPLPTSNRARQIQSATVTATAASDTSPIQAVAAEVDASVNHLLNVDVLQTPATRLANNVVNAADGYESLGSDAEPPSYPTPPEGATSWRPHRMRPPHADNSAAEETRAPAFGGAVQIDKAVPASPSMIASAGAEDSAELYAKHRLHHALSSARVRRQSEARRRQASELPKNCHQRAKQLPANTPQGSRWFRNQIASSRPTAALPSHQQTISEQR